MTLQITENLVFLSLLRSHIFGKQVPQKRHAYSGGGNHRATHFVLVMRKPGEQNPEVPSLLHRTASAWSFTKLASGCVFPTYLR